MKRVLITGASGFLADKIFETLNSFNQYEIILGARTPSKLSSIAKYTNSHIKHFNMAEPNTFSSALNGVDIVIHLAAMDYANCEKNPELAKTINVENLKILVDTCKTSNVQQFIYFSTIHVYGTNLSGIITEETPANPSNTYSKTHFEAENIVLNQNDFTGTIVRLSNAFGVPLFSDSATWNLVVNDLCRQTVINKKMMLNSSGRQLRDFIPASAIGILLNQLILKNVGNSIFNIGSGRSRTILEIIKIIQDASKKALGYIPEVEIREINCESQLDFTYSIEKITKLGIKLEINFEDEIKKILFSLKA